MAVFFVVLPFFCFFDYLFVEKIRIIIEIMLNFAAKMYKMST